MRMEVLTQPTRSEWEAVLDGSRRGNYRQCLEYGDAILGEDRATRVVRFLARSDKPLGVLQAVHPRRPFSRLLMGGSSGGGPTVVELPEDGRRQVVSTLVSAAMHYGRLRFLDSARIHTFRRDGLVEVLTSLHGYRFTREAGIFVVPLCRDLSAMFDRLDSPKRRNVRQASEHGVIVRTSKERRDLHIFHAMYSEFARAKSFKAMSERHLEALWEAFRSRNAVQVFIAEQGNNPIASALVLNHLDTAFCPYTCYLEAARETRANDLLHWRIMEWAGQSGIEIYNMGEVFLDPSCPQHGVYRWKKGFGGRVEPMAIMDRSLLPLPESIKTRLRGWPV